MDLQSFNHRKEENSSDTSKVGKAEQDGGVKKRTSGVIKEGYGGRGGGGGASMCNIK